VFVISAKNGSSEHVAVEGDVVVHAAGRQRHVVDLAHGGADGCEPLRADRERRALPLRGDVPVDLPEDLVQMAARIAVAERAPVAGDRLLPPLAEPGRLDAAGRLLELLLPRRPPRDVAQTRRTAGGEDEAVVERIAPRAQVHRPVVAAGLREPEHPREELERRLRVRGLELDVGELRQQTEHRHLPRTSGAPRIRAAGEADCSPRFGCRQGNASKTRGCRSTRFWIR
jgi:hypothetical protein